MKITTNFKSIKDVYVLTKHINSTVYFKYRDRSTVYANEAARYTYDEAVLLASQINSTKGNRKFRVEPLSKYVISGWSMEMSWNDELVIGRTLRNTRSIEAKNYGDYFNSLDAQKEKMLTSIASKIDNAKSWSKSAVAERERRIEQLKKEIEDNKANLERDLASFTELGNYLVANSFDDLYIKGEETDTDRKLKILFGRKE